MDGKTKDKLQAQVRKLAAIMERNHPGKDDLREICFMFMEEFQRIHHEKVCGCEGEGCVRRMVAQAIAEAGTIEHAFEQKEKVKEAILDAVNASKGEAVPQHVTDLLKKLNRNGMN